jgi:heat shock protein HtpX
MDGPRRTVELGVAEGEYAAVRGRQPVTTVLTSGLHRHNWRAQVCRGRVTVEGRRRLAVAGRIAPVLEDLCTRADCSTPKVVIRDDAVRAACVRKSRGRLLLVLSGSYLDRVDDRELRAVLAHEVVHIARDDLHWVKVRLWVCLVFAGAASVAVVALAGGDVAPPVYGAAGILALMVANVGLSTFHRRLERRADLEGASLCGDPIALASALGIAKAFSDEARRRLFGPRPWRWILSPLSWRMPTHPPMSDRIRQLRELAAIRSAGGAWEPSDPLPGITQ